MLLDELDAATRRDLAERAVKVLDQAYPAVEYANWHRCERLVPHALAVWGWIEGKDLRIPEAARLLNQVGSYLYLRALYAEAEPLFRRALAIREKALGPDHPNTALSLNNLAELYRAQGQYAEAEPLYRQALAITRSVAGPPRYGLEPEQPGGALPRAGPLRRGRAAVPPVLAIREKALGPDHPDTAQSLNNLAELYDTQGRYDEAEPLYRGRWRSASRRWARSTRIRPPA